MATTQYNLHLKGFVGGADFDRNYVDYVLGKQVGKPVHVLIDSLGGSVATALSIASAFRNHSDVTAHFVGMNASAATIASLGAKHISIDANAMYLVHKCSMALFSALQSAFGDNEWGSLNADQFATLIADCEKIKADLDKLDCNIASMYAAKCKKNHSDLLALMQRGGWLTAKEAKDWGFVDEVTNLATDNAPKLSDAVAAAMANAGMPIPNIPLAEQDRESAFGKFLSAITSIFKSQTPDAMPSDTTTKTYSEEEYNALNQKLTDANALTEAQKKTIEDRDKTIADLQAKLAAKPAVESKQVVEDSKPGEQQPKNDVEQFVDTYNSARALFNEV